MNIIKNKNIPNTQTSMIKQKVKIIKMDQLFWYMSCVKCTKTTPYKFEEKFTCYVCQQDECKAIPKVT